MSDSIFPVTAVFKFGTPPTNRRVQTSVIRKEPIYPNMERGEGNPEFMLGMMVVTERPTGVVRILVGKLTLTRTSIYHRYNFTLNRAESLPF